MALLQDIVGQMHSRVEELRPAVDEYNELTEALASLNGAGVEAEPKLTLNEVRAMAGLPPTAAEQPVKRKRGRPKGSGQTRQKIMDTIHVAPGLTINQIASALHMKPNYLYRALPAMAEEGKIVQRTDDKTWWPR